MPRLTLPGQDGLEISAAEAGATDEPMTCKLWIDVAQMTLGSPRSVLNGAREVRRHLLRARPAEGHREAPSFAELSATFVEAAKSDLR